MTTTSSSLPQALQAGVRSLVSNKYPKARARRPDFASQTLPRGECASTVGTNPDPIDCFAGLTGALMDIRIRRRPPRLRSTRAGGSGRLWRCVMGLWPVSAPSPPLLCRGCSHFRPASDVLCLSYRPFSHPVLSQNSVDIIYHAASAAYVHGI